MEPTMPEMYLPPNLHKLEPLPKYSIKFLHHELDCRSFESKRPATHQLSPDYKNLSSRCRNRLRTDVKST
jgi:hypothetical protein